jgi:hypothetical protein
MATHTPVLLGQSAPSATTETDVYTVPGSTNTVVSSIFICNRGTATGTFRLYIRDAGATAANKQYLYYDVEVPAKDTFLLVAGITLEATDKVTVYMSTADFSVNVFGTEVT